MEFEFDRDPNLAKDLFDIRILFLYRGRINIIDFLRINLGCGIKI